MEKSGEKARHEALAAIIEVHARDHGLWSAVSMARSYATHARSGYYADSSRPSIIPAWPQCFGMTEEEFAAARSLIYD